MQLERHGNNPILKPAKNNFWESGSVFNPGAVIGDDGKIHLVYRAIPEGFRKKAGGNFGPGGAGYKNYVSSIGHAVSNDGVNFDQRRLFFKPEYEWEQFVSVNVRLMKHWI